MLLATGFWMIALLLSALASGVAFSHVLEIPGKRRMRTEHAIVVQQVLYVGYRMPAAVIEVGALLATALATLLVWGDGTRFWLSVVT
jgi:hypothetical protein